MKFLLRVIIKTTAVIFLFAILICSKGYCQIKVYERPSPVFNSNGSVVSGDSGSVTPSVTNQGIGNEKGGGNENLYSPTSTRKIISLNGEWNVSFNEGKSFNALIIPCAYTEQGTVLFKKKFTIDRDSVAMYSFFLVAEGIQYDAEILINSQFIIKQSAASSSLIIPLDDGIIINNNDISIAVSNVLNRNKTIPLSNQINYGNIYGGINRDIYIVAVPKIYSLRSFADYRFENDGSVNFRNVITVRSTKLDSTARVGRQFYAQTRIFKKSTGEQAGESQKQNFKIENNNLATITTEQSLRNVSLWSPEDPALYIVKTFIYSSGGGANDELIDEYICETGFRKVVRNGNNISLNGKDLKLNGINYYEDSYKYANAISYQETEKDIANIKKLGFNSIRVPGASPNPYLLKLCDRYGLFIFYDIPFNTVNSTLIAENSMKTMILNYLSAVIIRDRNSPSIIAWGLGNDEDVTKSVTVDYLKAAVRMTDTLSKRLTYYTSMNYSSDICDGITDMKGVNFYDNDITKIEKFAERSAAGKTKSMTFVSYYGAQTELNNRNGFSDMHSYEYQSKYLADAYKLIAKVTTANIIASYDDWNSQQPLLYHFSDDIDMRTNGLFTATGEPKQAGEFVRRVIAGEENPILQEGENHTILPQIFMITGIIFILILFVLFSQNRVFRVLVMRSIFQPDLFYQNAKEQSPITTILSLFLVFVISIGMAVFLGNIFYFYREINNFDLLVSGFAKHDTKVLFSSLLNNPVYFLLVFAGASIAVNFWTCLLIYMITIRSRRRVFFRHIYTISVWSAAPLLVCLPVGTVFLKMMPYFNGFIYVSIFLVVFAFVLFLLRLIIGARIFFESSFTRAYLFGSLFTILIFGSIYLYFKLFTSGFEIMSLILNNLN